ncbi:MAG: glutamate--tRNA ligase [Bacteroidales bacterium]
MSGRKVRVRFAPSPTGPLHIGGIRTALYNWLFAKQRGGDLILRIEDTDSRRFVSGAEAYIVEAFEWLGITFDESPALGGRFAPYRQSERKHIYKEYADKLLEKGFAYYAFDTPAALEAKRKETPNFQYDASVRMQMRNSLTLPEAEWKRLIDNGEKYVVRIKIEPDKAVCVNDLIRGEVTFNASALDDKVLFKSADGLPTYHLANVVDDRLMEITHVIRGEEWLPSAPLHVLLYRCFGWTDAMPQFAHLPLLLKPEGNGKLSKRDGDRLGFPVFPLAWKDPATGEFASGYRESGYLPEAVVNFLALLGWNPGNDREMMSREEMVRLFDFSHCSKSGAKFDFEKAKWFNHQYIREKSNAEVAALFMPVLKEHGVLCEAAYVERVVGLTKERVDFVRDLWEQAAFFFIAPASYDEQTVKKRWKEDSAACLAGLADLLRSCNLSDAAGTEDAVKVWMESKGYHSGNIMNVLRLALVGEGKGPRIFDITAALGKDETIRRIRRAIEILK